MALAATACLLSGFLTPGFSFQRGKGLQPPPPPPYESSQLAPWAEVGSAKLAKGLAMAKSGQVEKALQAWEAAADALEAEEKARLEKERERLLAFQTFRSDWLRELAKDGKNLRLPVEGKMTAFKIDRIEAGIVHFQKARKGVESVPLAELSPELMLENLGRGLKKVEPTWMQAYLPSLAQQEFDSKKLDGVDAAILKDFEDYGWMLDLGALSQEIEALSQLGYPEDHATQMAALDRLGAVMAKQKAIPALKGIDQELKSYAADMAKLAFASGGLGDLLHGKVTDLGEGRWRIVYEFDNAKELEDFQSIPDLFEFCLPQADKPADPAKSGYLHNESALAWAGRVGILHHVPFEGAMSAKYEWKMSKIGNSFDIQGGNLVFGLAANPKELSYIGQAFIHSAWCYQRGQLVNHSHGVKPIYPNRAYQSEVVRDEAGQVTTASAGTETGTVSIPDVSVGPFFLAANLNIRGRIERLELEGKAYEPGLTYLRKLRAYEHLRSLDLEGRPPEKPSED